MRSQVDMFFVVFLYFVFFLFLYFVFDIPYFTSDAYNIRPAHMRSQVDVFLAETNWELTKMESLVSRRVLLDLCV